MKLIDWFRKKIYKNYVSLDKYARIVESKDYIIERERLTNKVHRGEIQELKQKISILESEKLFKPVVTEPIRFKELHANITMNPLDVQMMPQNWVNENVTKLLAEEIAKSVLQDTLVVEDYDAITNTYNFRVRAYIGTKGDN